MTISQLLLETDNSEVHESEVWVVRAPSNEWQFKKNGIWVHASLGRLPKFGWKIHVSAKLEDAPFVLAVVSEVAFAFECDFKYLKGVESFLLLHFKNANRLQSGKFIALYPETQALAGQLLEALYNHLNQYQGLDVLTDRSYKNSTNIYYRWGAFYSTGRLNAAGKPEELVSTGTGEMVPDIRLPRFVLPEGITDPFCSEVALTPQYFPPESVLLDQFRVESVLRFTNAGGRYKGTCQLSGVEVVIKEARPNTGFVGREEAIPRLHREVALMEELNSKFNSLTPSVIKKFSIRDHEYVALEYLPGTPLSEWIARENPLYSCLHKSPKHVREYFTKCSKILEVVSLNLAKLHSLGLAYGDLSLGNIIVDDWGNARFIDFEACTSVDDVLLGLRTPDFCLLHQKGEISAKERDHYAYNCIAVSLILRLTTLAEVSDHVLQAVAADLAMLSHEVPQWWFESCEHLTLVSQRHSSCKVSNFVPPSLNSYGLRASLRGMIASAALDCYAPETPHLFPVGAVAREGAFLSFGFGCSGLLRALRMNGNHVSDQIKMRYADCVSRAMDKQNLPLNYYFGIAGFIETCLQLGLNELYLRIIDEMIRNWDRVRDPSLATGLTGLSLAFLRQGHVALAEEVMARAIQMTATHKWSKNGLLYGRSGVIAGACQFDALLKSDAKLSGVMRDIISEELEQTVPHPKAKSLSLRGEVDGSRVLPYLCDGTAGLLLALICAHENRYIDYTLERDVVVALSADLGTPFMLEGSLMDGAAGLAIALELARYNFNDIVDKIPEPGWGRIQKYFLPLKSGVGVFHPKSLKFDLSHSQGSLGILESLLWFDGIAELNISGLHIPPRSF